ncbi:MAG: hemerythrin domain-containing protein [Terriglobia bacterium]
MKQGKRHDSLIPLSREHHYGLMVSLRIHRGLEQHEEDADWLSQRASKAIRFFDSDLKSHFKTEEEIVFPAMSSIDEAKPVVEELIREHRELKRLVHDLGQARERQLAPLLREFADLLEAHIRKEERVLFPIYEQKLSVEIAEQVGAEVLRAEGPALRPKQPELLE